VPSGRGWLHEVKYYGYRTIVIREQDRARLINRGGYDWADRFPLIVAAALKLRRKHFVPDGEVVVLDKDGEDLRTLPLSLRKSKLARLLARPVDI
jgi:bifunctional non-homologous end joining protein LigD